MTRQRVLLGLLLLWPLILAHSGTPYPVLLEQAVGPYVVSALADPDVGLGMFIVAAELANGSATPGGTTVTLWVQPEDGHASETGYAARREEMRRGERFVARVAFDAEGPWQVRLVLDGPAGQGETTFPVEVTPPGGIGWGTLLCLLPFVALGALWAVSALRHRS